MSIHNPDFVDQSKAGSNPQITPDGGIILMLDINKDSRRTNQPLGFGINTKHVKTEVLVDNGGTVVIGGILTKWKKILMKQRCHFLVICPALVYLFKSKTKTNAKKELLVFITPKSFRNLNAHGRVNPLLDECS
ncbi:hypothetical protein [Candidatus Aalborgicola defluviihabitans]|uniref:hypothetical protein n=1 Tax=Candidatus Aalborgicola defluviihabitans TaxID=3386187 RepID=UPI001EC09EF8|nr:hypothetical protein [Burkholderiales bacterium]